jgi:dihydroxyacetone kinase-like predicted kinase
MNPATRTYWPINKTPAETVFVLPNNKNIILAAEQCVHLTPKKVVVIRTTTIQQGVAAMLAVEPDAPVEKVGKAMSESASRVTSISVTYAARDSVFDGTEIKEGDYLVLQDNRLFCTERLLESAIERIASLLKEKSCEIISVFYGEDVSEQQAKAW